MGIYKNMSSLDNSETKHYSRNKGSSFDVSRGGKGSVVETEVQKLFKKSDGSISQHDLMKLRNKFNDEELVEEIKEAFVERQGKIQKRATKFASLIREKYANTNYPFHKLLAK